MTDKPYLALARHYERCLEEHGDTCRGVDWPKEQDAATRYAIMLGVMPPERPATLLDLGCGAGHLLEFIRREGRAIDYSGLDISAKFIELCRRKFPGVLFHCADLLADRIDLPRFDCVIMNGVFTEKRELSFDEMLAFFRAMVRCAFELADVGIGFNVMSKQVDWERSDLFHLPLDELSRFLTAEVSRHFVIRHDYGLYEYACYVYRSSRN